MAVTSTAKKVAVNIVLNNSTQEGKLKTVNVSLGNLSVTGYDSDKAANLIQLISPCLTKEVYEIDEVKTNILEVSD